ncbi:MAG: TonB-dependent receptor plug domain-containing protein [Ginsengibacter sp.]
MKKIAFVEFTKILFLLSTTGLFIFASPGDKPPAKALERLIEKYYSFHKQFPQQKIYIQTDKPYYISGDEMYGKVYLINESRWKIDSLRSKKIYVELVNSNNEVIDKTIVNGIYSNLDFTFHLPDSTRDGDYILRAYTSWMLGFDNAQNIFRNSIHIFNKTKSTETQERSTTTGKDLDVQFLPEGGYLVNGIENFVAFKAIDKTGLGKDVSGFIKNSEGEVVCKFNSTHLGMGKFEFIPETGTSYEAYVKTEDGNQIKIPLTPADNYGYQLSVIKRNEDTLTARVALGDSLYQKNKTSYLIATSHAGVYFTSKGRGMYEENIPLKKFPEGIAKLSLFDSAMQPQSERLIYIHHPGAKVAITTNKRNFRPREKVTLKLKTVGVTGELLKGIYSISVTDDHVVKYDKNEGNIKTHLLLSPYLKGYIEDPGFYFNDDDSTTLKDLDLVMLTHGWSRFSWNNIQNGIAPNRNEKDSSLTISGKITTIKNKPAVHYTVTLISPSANAFVGTDVTNEKGEFRFSGIDYGDTNIFLIQAKNPKGVNEDVNVAIDDEHFPLIAANPSPIAANLSSNEINGFNFYKRFMYDSIEINKKEKMLKEIIIKHKKLSYDQSTRVSTASYVITPQVIERYGNGNVTLNDLLMMVPGYTGHDGQISFFGLNGYGNSSPLLIVDGVEGVGIDNIDPSSVSYIEVLRGGEAAIYGMRGAGGAIVIHTKKGSDMNGNYVKQKGIKIFNAGGYEVAKEFYSPNYETDESRYSKNTDKRTTIYWNGYVNTNSKFPTTISFYTADMPTTYTLTIEGIAENGDLIHESIPIERTR